MSDVTGLDETADAASGATAEVLPPPIGFHVPEGMHAVSLTLDPAERAEAAAELVRDIYPKGDEQLWQAMGAIYVPVLEAMAGNGVCFTGIGIYDDQEGGVAHCSLTVAAMESDHTSAEAAALGLREVFGRRPKHDVRWLDLPCGPAVAVVTVKALTIDGDYTESGEDTRLITGQIQVYIPFPTGPYTAVFTLDTSAMNQWDDLSELMAEIVKSVAFPQPEGTEGG
ncbi:hypothetical protein O7599_03920 [Streptomyces sp. WMMC500]|uniref:hypothetical protein n=1 Tax=Streptomyces sp. WMMC500 TaxID=3015154 RepID=UPI00248AFE76|nr:hypothetical protein [Streptomyces sp. WMMC500]WBB61712.1 hypothetical protein O7599_03920 [Streptomyces sp. WMMC500]